MVLSFSPSTINRKNVFKILILSLLLFLSACTLPPKPNITDFDSCTAAGFPVMESYPPRCKANGQTYTQDIGNELELQDQIRIENPRPTQLITAPLKVVGAARGSWFFEASFTVKLVDEAGHIITEAQARADENWMTENFVPFSTTLNFTPTDNKIKGTLVLEKANPSALPEHAASLHLPIRY